MTLNICTIFLKFIIDYFRGARHGLLLSGKLSRIEAQEKQLLAKSKLSAETATDIFQNWVQVKRKHKNRNKPTNPGTSSTDAIELNDITKSLPSSPDSDPLTGLIDQSDYQIKISSRKKKKQQRKRDEELAKSLSQLSASEITPTSSLLHLNSVQNKSKAIKKEKQTVKKKHRRRHHAMDADEDTTDDGFMRKKRRKNKRNGIDGKLTDLSSSDCDEKDISNDPLVQQIADVMKKYPSKRFKVIAEELTPFQKKHLRRSGLRIELKSKKRDKKKRIKEQAQLDKISKKIEKSMVFDS